MEISYRHIETLIEEGESETLDFKHCITSSRKIAVAISAFANRYGGILLIGIKDNGKPAKINIEEECYMLEAAVNLCSPIPEMSIQVLAYRGKEIVYAVIEKMKDDVVFCPMDDQKQMAFIRVKDENLQAHWVWVQAHLKDRKEQATKFSYKIEEEIVLKTLDKFAPISQQELKKHTKINFHRLGKILVMLLKMNVLRIDHAERESQFSLNRSGVNKIL